MARVYFRKHRTINPPRKINEPVIECANHASALLDPILLGANHIRSIHFMVRADIFNAFVNPLFNGTQMIPVYRKDDGGKEALDRNEASFNKVKRLLKKGKAILFFAEGYTDNVFIRSLKPVKKGPARVGFEMLEECDWSKPLYMQAIGINYSDPDKTQSDIVFCYGELVDFHEYKDLYQEHPAKAITEMTKRIQDEMQAQITYCKNTTVAEVLEHIISINRKGMNALNNDSSISPVERFRYTQALANKLNDDYNDSTDSFETDALNNFKDKAHQYFNELHAHGIKERWVFEKMERPASDIFTVLKLLLLLPFYVVGLAQCLVPYLITKKYVEKNFKRRVFWSGVKIAAGWFIFGLWNITFIFLFYNFVYPNVWAALAYYFFGTPVIMKGFYVFKEDFLDLLKKLTASKKDLIEFSGKRKELKEILAELPY